jgi:hypothetical protein
MQAPASAGPFDSSGSPHRIDQTLPTGPPVWVQLTISAVCEGSEWGNAIDSKTMILSCR